MYCVLTMGSLLSEVPLYTTLLHVYQESFVVKINTYMYTCNFALTNILYMYIVRQGSSATKIMKIYI